MQQITRGQPPKSGEILSRKSFPKHQPDIYIYPQNHNLADEAVAAGVKLPEGVPDVSDKDGEGRMVRFCGWAVAKSDKPQIWDGWNMLKP